MPQALLRLGPFTSHVSSFTEVSLSLIYYVHNTRAHAIASKSDARTYVSRVVMLYACPRIGQLKAATLGSADVFTSS